MMSVFRNIKENTREISQHNIEYLLKTTYISVQQFFNCIEMNNLCECVDFRREFSKRTTNETLILHNDRETKLGLAKL